MVLFLVITYQILFGYLQLTSLFSVSRGCNRIVYVHVNNLVAACTVHLLGCCLTFRF